MSSAGDYEVQHRLATYGSLAPGRPNAHQLSSLEGRWAPGTVRGHLHERGWGAAAGYPGIILDDAGPVVAVQVFTSAQLPAHWERLDDFEGPGYRRVPVTVHAGGAVFPAYIYALADETAATRHRIASNR